MAKWITSSNLGLAVNGLNWEILRKTYRIVGELLGNTSFLPVLPLKLLPEEAYLLLYKNVATLVKYDNLKTEPSKQEQEETKMEQEKLIKQLQTSYKQIRKRQLEAMINKIVDAKKSKGVNTTKEEIFQEELDKIANINEENMIYPNLLLSLQAIKGQPTTLPKEIILKQISIHKCKIYADLWEKGYFITCGSKFGGEYLLYEGDPILFHAVYIVRCVENINTKLNPTEIIAFGRLANSVKKKAILANSNDTGVSYITLSWPHM